MANGAEARKMERQDLEAMEVADLEALIILAQEVLAEKKRGREEFEFNFEATSDPRKGVPYVAFLKIRNGKLEREFVNNMTKTWGRKEVTVAGRYRARAGDVVEIRTGGSWKNDYRAWYVVSPDGKLVRAADIQDSAAKLRVERYLRGEIGAEELLPK